VPKPKREWDPQLIVKWAINGKLENLLSCWRRERREKGDLDLHPCFPKGNLHP
jgi:hypothetical protein